MARYIGRRKFLATLGSASAVAAREAAGILLVPVEVCSPDKLGSAFATLGTERVEALLVPPDTTFYSRRRQIADLAARTRLPTIYGYREHVEDGGLMSYGPDIPDQYRRPEG